MDFSTHGVSSKRPRDDGRHNRAATLPRGVDWLSSSLASEVEQAEVLGHEQDTTEARAIGVDDDVATLAYGGEYFLREANLAELSSRHPAGLSGRADSQRDTGVASGSGGGGGRQEEKAELYVNAAFAQPRFFLLGKDFPSVDVPRAVVDDGDETGGSGAPASTPSLWAAAHETDADILLPVVSAQCAMAQLASKGSAALADLRRLLAREQQNRDAMDTSRSSLTQLLKKDPFGREVPAAGTDPAALCDTTSSTSFLGLRDPDGPTSDEVEGLRRKLRLEQAALRSKTTPHPPGDTRGKGEGEGAGGNRPGLLPEDLRRQQQRSFKREKLEHILAAQAALDHTADSEAEAERREELRRKQEQLPIFRCRRELLRCIAENTVTIIAGETGSGKTTQLVRYLYEEGYARYGTIIGCTQPRRLATIAVARRVSEEMRCALGTTVGYSIHLDDTTTDQTKIKFMTDGVLLREVVKDPNLDSYGILMIDEAHERSVDTDVLMGILKDAIRSRGDLKLIISSATMDVQKFSRFFGNAPYYEIPGQTYEVEIRYSPKPVMDYVAEAVFRVCQLHLQAPMEARQDILVFMTGRDDVYGTCELIRRRLAEISPEHLKTLMLLPCLSEASGVSSAGEGVANLLLAETPSGLRKCVVSTNVAETSLTIDGVRYVVDCGLMKTNVFRPRLGMNTLQRYPVSQAQANQRKGRAGRTAEGVCFRLYTEEQFAREMLLNSVPEIQRSSLDSVVLLLKGVGVRRIREFEFVDPPPAANIRSSMWRLWVLGMLDVEGEITDEGRLAIEFPIAPALAKLLLESTKHGCSFEVARIVALITADPKNFFELPKGKEAIAQQHFGRFFNNESDHLTLLNAFTQFLENGKSRQWAQDHYLHFPTLQRACDVLEQLLDRLRQLRLPVVSCQQAHGGALDVVRYCLARAFCLQAAQRSGSNWNEYRALLNLGVVCALHPSSAICTSAVMPSFVVYNDLIMVHKEYLVLVTAVEPEWLAEGGLYKVKKTGKTSGGPLTQAYPVIHELPHARSVDGGARGRRESGEGDTKRQPDPLVAVNPKPKLLPTKPSPVGGKSAPNSSKFAASFSGKKRANI
ncbi:unnamed protein product [Phytomonas sp. EM1]|nr:unnamed protein product [Phytomonas sp. EM1]|eukprot:CCW62546.1 unnamed protein product [Phytomonas sp. isolate EM1]